MKINKRLFRTVLFGGYNKADVTRYIRRLEEELEARDREAEEYTKKNEDNQKLIGEAICEIQRLRSENEQLRKDPAPESSLRRELRERRERMKKDEGG